jgi:hypothetical protein
MFGKKSPEKTVLILDIENGSVASALAQLASGEAPRLFAAERTGVPLLDTRSALQLARAVEHTAGDALLRASEAAARLRHGNAVGPVDEVVAFLAAPWGVPNLQAGRPDFSAAITNSLSPRIASLFGDIPVALHAHASAAVHGLRALYPEVPHALLVSVNGEISELLLLQDGHVVGHATAPAGLGTILRTLKAHGGLSEHEARSAMRLGQANEAMRAAAEHFAGEFKQAARELMAGQGSNNVFVLAHEPGSEWFARSLSHRSIADLFPQSGVVRAIRNSNLSPFVSSAGTQDAHLALNALYASAAHK